MSAWAPTSEALWTELAQQPTSDRETATLPLRESRLGSPLYIALTKEGARCLLIPLHPDETAGVPISTKSISSGIRVLSGPAGLNRYLEVKCVDRQLSSRFGVIASDIAHAVNNQDGAHPSGAVSSVLSRWRLLINGSVRRFTEAQLIGLWGELHVLELLSSLTPKAAEYWRGFLNEIHDFRNGLQLIEVKTGLYSSNDFVIINGVEQLEDPLGGGLALARVRIEKDGSGRSVGDLFDAVAASWTISESTESALEEHGISRSALAAYSDSRFKLRELNLFEISEGFPRITRASFAGGSVPPGTSTLRYEVDLAMASPNVIPHAKLMARLREFVDA